MTAETPAPKTPIPNQPVFLWPTPDKRDLMFYVWRDGKLNPNKAWAYGEAYPDSGSYPTHTLVHVSPEGENKWSKWYYAAPRAEQDKYNFEFTQADIGGTKFDAVSRTYVTPRSSFNPGAHTMGEAMPNVPAGVFTGDYVLAERKEKRGDPELDSIFVTEELVFVKRVPMVKNDFDEALSGSLQTVQTLYFKGESVSGAGVAQVESLTVLGSVPVGGHSQAVLSIPTNPTEATSVTGVTAERASHDFTLAYLPAFISAHTAGMDTNASVSLELPVNPTSGDYITIGGFRFDFVPLGTAGDDPFKIDTGSAVSDTYTNMAAKVNITGYSTGLNFVAYTAGVASLVAFAVGPEWNGVPVASGFVNPANYWAASGTSGGGAVTSYPDDFDTITINGVAFDFKSSELIGDHHNIPIGSSIAETMFYLADGINHSAEGLTPVPPGGTMDYYGSGIFTWGTEGVSGNSIPWKYSNSIRGTLASGTLTGGVDAVIGVTPHTETVTINGTAFTFKNAPSAAHDVQIGASKIETQANLVSVVNAASCGGTFAPFSGNSATFTWGSPGTSGDAITVSETMVGTGNAWSGSGTLSGGGNSGAGNLSVTFTSAAVVGSPITISVEVAGGDTAELVANKVAQAIDAVPAVYAAWLPAVTGNVVSVLRRAKVANDGTANIALALGTAGGITPVATSDNAVAGSLASDTVEALFLNKNSPYWGLQGDFTEREGVQLTDNCFVVTTAQVVPSTYATSGRTYGTTVEHGWPAVLDRIQIDVWNKNSGGRDVITTPFFKQVAYHGPCHAVVSEKFYLNPPAVSQPRTLLPLPIDIQSPLFSVHAGPTLHGAISLTMTTGTDDPTYVYTVANFVFPATSPTDWPATVIASDEVRPFRGGYQRVTVTVSQPITK